MKRVRFLSQLAGLGATLVACVGVQSGASTSEQTVHFLRQKVTDGAQMEALLDGELVLADGCLRIKENYGEESYAAIWPFEFNFEVQNGNVDILNGEGRVVAQVGDQVRISGGEIPRFSEKEFEQNYLGTLRCSGRYWLVGYEVAVITR
jgi:hypothetical protein